eukprot:1455841-Pleurochrysis_carterae.AAC.1
MADEHHVDFRLLDPATLNHPRAKTENPPTFFVGGIFHLQVVEQHCTALNTTNSSGLSVEEREHALVLELRLDSAHDALR